MSSILNTRAVSPILTVLWLAAGGSATAQSLTPPPNYSDSAVTEGAEETVTSWNAWLEASRNLEHDVPNAPMGEARDRIQRAFTAWLNFSDKRRIYSERVAGYIERFRPEAPGRKPLVNVETVSRDQLELLGISLSAVQARLDALRDTPVWAPVRRAVQTDRSEMMTLQNARRDDIPVDLPYGSAAPVRPLSLIVYRDSEHQVREAVDRIWTHYYQALADAVVKNGTSTPLVTTLTLPAAPVADPAAAVAAEAPVVGIDRVAGTWRYVDGSQRFNGVEEPHDLLLELFAAKGVLTGRYRGTLTDFTGPHVVDVRLQQVPAAKGSSEIRLQFQNPEQNVSGQIVIEGPGASGLELQVIHMDGAGLPRGREILARR